MRVVKDAGVDREGNVYEYSEIVSWVELHGTSPLTGKVLLLRFIYIFIDIYIYT